MRTKPAAALVPAPKGLLFVFDETVLTRGVGPAVPAGARVRLFPLTARPEAVRHARERLGAAGADVEELPSGRFVDEAAARLRTRYIEFVADLPRRCREAGADVKGLFAVDAHASLWWFSLVAEKNTVKSDAFHRLAQADAAAQVAGESGAQEARLCLRHYRLSRVLRSRLESMGLTVHLCNPSRLQQAAQSPFGLYLRSLATLLRFAVRSMGTGWLTRLAVGGPPAHRKDTPFLFVTYYPNLDRSLAEKGIFHNAYCRPLQESLERGGVPTTWLALSVGSAASFRDGLRWAAGFRKRGTDFLILEQFAGWLLPLRTVWETLRSGWRFHRLQPAIERACLWDGVSIFPILAWEWYDSFAGETGFTGLWFYRVFQEVCRRLGPRKVLYYQEMHAWEKALIAAAAGHGGGALLLGYQHAATPWMLLNFFNSPSELGDRGRYPLPQPGHILCDGEVSRRYMRGCGWPEGKLLLAEAVRYAYLAGCRGRNWDKRDAVLIPLSISIVESAAILSMAREALRGLVKTEVWIKPHPLLALDKVWERSGLSPRAPGWSVVEGAVGPWLEKAKVVVVGESGVALEALASGCRVVVASTPELVNLSPLWGMTCACVTKADSVSGLREAVMKDLAQPIDEKDQEDAWRIVDDFFCFADEGAGAPRILDIIMGRQEAAPAAAEGGLNG